MLRTGFQGAYRYRPHSQSQKGGAGTILQMPVKDEYSHVQDALQYATLAVRRWLDKRESKLLTNHAGQAKAIYTRKFT